MVATETGIRRWVENRERRAITGRHDERYPVPDERRFREANETLAGRPTPPFMRAPDLEDMAEQLIDAYGELVHIRLHDLRIVYLWQLRGQGGEGQAGGRLVQEARRQRPGGLVAAGRLCDRTGR